MPVDSPRARDPGRRLRRRRWYRWTAVAGVAVAGLAAAGVWRLTDRPVVVPVLSSYLADRLDQASLPVAAEWEEVALHWPFMAPWLHVWFADVSASELLEARRIGVRIPLRDLVRGRVAVAGVVLEAPELAIIQSEDGDLQWGGGTSVAGPESPLAAVLSGTTIEVIDGVVTLALREASSGVRIAGIQASLEDQEGQIVLRGTGVARFPGHASVPLELSAGFEKRRAEVGAELVLGRFEPRLLGDLLGVNVPLHRLQVPLGGTVTVAGPMDAVVIALAAAGADGHLSVPDPRTDSGSAVLPVDAVRMNLQYGVAERILELREFTVSGPAGKLRVDGNLPEAPDRSGFVGVTFAGALPVDDVTAWAGLGLNPATVRWLQEHVEGGTLTAVSGRADFPVDGSADPDLEINGAVRDAVVDWRDGAPPLRLAAAEVNLVGPALSVTAPVAVAGPATLRDFRLASSDVLDATGEVVLTARLSGESGALLRLAGAGPGSGAEPALRGPVQDAAFRVRIPLDSARDEEIFLQSEFQGLRVDPSGLPARYAGLDVRELSGTLAYGPAGLDLRFGGELGASIAIRDGTLAAAGPEAPSWHLAATLSGPVADLVRIAGGTGWPPAAGAVTGTAEVRAAVSIPRHADAPPALKALTGSFVVPSLTAEALGLGLGGENSFRDVQGDVELQEGALVLSGLANLAESRFWFHWRTPASEDPGEEEITIRGSFGANARAALGLPLRGLEGTVDLVGSAVRRANGTAWELGANADLAAAELSVAALGWVKPRGVPLEARIRGVLADGEALEIRLEGGEIDVQSYLWLQDRQVDRAVFNRLQIGEHRLAGTVARAADGRFGIVLDGEQVDLRPFFSAGQGPPASVPSLALRLDSGLVRTMAPAPAGPLAVSLDADADGVRNLHVGLELADGEVMELRGVRDGAALKLLLTGSDAHSVADALGLRVAADDGAVRVEAVQQDGRVAGTVHVDEFAMVDAPVFLQLLQSISLIGLLERAATGGSLMFSSFDAEFTLADGVLTVRNGIARGLMLGMTVEGEIDTRKEVLSLRGALIPVYAISWLLSQVPVLDDLMTGTDSRGVVAADYAVEGPASDPVVTVNPMQFLLPGILRELFPEGAEAPSGSPRN